MIRKITKKYNTVYVYQLPGDASRNGAVQWLCDMVNSQTLEAKRIVLQDMQRRSDEGNLSMELFPPLDCQNILEEVSKRNTDSISVSGMLQVPVSIHLDLETFEISIAMDNSSLADPALLETTLHLK